jgi:ankyrin repeat protein
MLVSGEIPLFVAIHGQGSRAIVQYLISSGADPNEANNRGITPLHLAAGQGLLCPCCVCFGVLAVSQ